MIKDNSPLSLQALQQVNFYHYNSFMKEKLITTFYITTFLLHGTLPKHQHNKHIMKEYFTEILLPFIYEKRRILKLSSEPAASFIDI